MKQIGYGADVGGTTVKLGKFSSEGELLKKWEIPTVTANEGVQILPDIAASIKEDLASMEEEVEVLGLGVGVPGPAVGGRVVNRCANLNWTGIVPVADILEAELGFPVIVDNDANVAGLGELWKGVAAGCKNVILMTFGTGIGGAVIVNGKAVSGTHGAGGEVGHICVESVDPEPCPCGRSGCIERYASASGLARQAVKYLNGTDRSSKLREFEELTAREIWDCYREGDEVTGEIVEEFGDRIGRAMAAMSCVTDPELFVAGGGMSRAGQVLADVLQKGFRKYCFHACEETPVAIATLGNDAGIYGCMYLLKNR